MKLKFILLSLSCFMSYGMTASAQDAPTVIRSFACSVNDGYAMSDVVEVARNLERDEGVAPAGIFFREAGVVRGEFQTRWDFVVSLFYNDMAHMVEHRGYLRSLEGGRTGDRALFSDMITCDPAHRIQFSAVANEGEIFSDSEATIMVQSGCDLNGATVADAIGLAAAQGRAVNAYSAVDSRIFGGPDMQQGSRVGMRFVFPSATDFGDSVDDLRNAGGPPQTNSQITCSVGSIWLSHRIYSSN